MDKGIVVNELQEGRRARAREERKARGVRWKAPADDGIGAFPLGPDGRPISEDTPGQAESRIAFGRFNEKRAKVPWWREYLDLRAEGWDWRRAALIAWLASPKSRRWPRTLLELATECLGLESDRAVRGWRQDDPGIDERAGRAQVAPLFEYRRDVIEALAAVAQRHDHLAHSDRKLFLEMTGDYRPASKAKAEEEINAEIEREMARVKGEDVVPF